MNFLVIDSQPLIVLGLTMTIKELFADAQVWDVSSVSDGIQLFDRHQFDCIISEIDTVSDLGDDLISSFRCRKADISILIYSRLDEEIFAVPVITAGANGYLSKRASREDLMAAIKMVAEGKKYMGPRLHERLVSQAVAIGKKADEPATALSNREKLVMKLMVQGKSTKDIAYALGIKENTVSTFKNRVYKKLRVTNSIELFQWASITTYERSADAGDRSEPAPAHY